MALRIQLLHYHIVSIFCWKNNSFDITMKDSKTHIFFQQKILSGDSNVSMLTIITIKSHDHTTKTFLESKMQRGNGSHSVVPF